MDKHYGNLIWTNHVLQRLKKHGISQSDAWATWRNPDNSRSARSKGAWVYYRTFNHKKFEVVAKKNEQGQWVILSVWSRPADLKKPKTTKPRSRSFWQLIWEQLWGKN